MFHEMSTSGGDASGYWDDIGTYELVSVRQTLGLTSGNKKETKIASKSLLRRKRFCICEAAAFRLRFPSFVPPILSAAFPKVPYIERLS